MENNNSTSPNENLEQSPSSNQMPPSGNSSAQTSLEPNVLAALAYSVSPLSGFIVLSMEKENSFVRFHAMQSIVMGVVGLLGMLASGVLSAVLIGVLLGPLVFLAYMYYWVLLMYKSYNNEEYEIPYIGKMARERLQAM